MAGIRARNIELGSGVAATRATLAVMRSVALASSQDPNVRAVAMQLIAGVPSRAYLTEAQKLSNFVRDQVRYTRDPQDMELLQDPAFILGVGDDVNPAPMQGDCDDKVTLLAALLMSVGFNGVRFVVVGTEKNAYSHVFLQVNVNGTWYPAETCPDPQLGKIPFGQEAAAFPYRMVFDLATNRTLAGLGAAGSDTVLAERDHVATKGTAAQLEASGAKEDAALAQQAAAQQAISIAAAAVKTGTATPAQQQLAAYMDDAAFDTKGPYNFSTALNESYYQYLPPLVRGHVVPAGYPVGFVGLDSYTAYAPRIVGISPDVPTSMQTVDLTQLRLAHPPANSMTIADLLKQPGVSVVVPNITWYIKPLGMYLTYAPHRTFDKLYQQKKIWADPADPYWQQKFNAWNEIPLALAFGRFIAGVALVIGAAYAIAAAGVDGSASAASAGSGSEAAGSGAGAGSLAPTEVEPATFTGEVAQPIAEVDTGLTASTMPTLSAADIGSVAATGAGIADSMASTVASDLIAGTKAVGAVMAADAAVKAMGQGVQPPVPGPAPSAPGPIASFLQRYAKPLLVVGGLAAGTYFLIEG